MKIGKLILISFLIAILFISTTVVAAAPPTESPAKGPPEYDKIVFIHYGEESHGAKPPGTPGGGNGGGNGDDTELYSYSRVHWADGDLPVGYYINTASSPIDIGSGIDAINGSFAIWEDDAESYIDFEYLGTTVVAPGLNVRSPDYVNVVGWADISATYPNAIGVTIIWSLRGKRLIVDVDTVLNTNSFFSWTVDNSVVDANSELTDADTTSYDVDVQNIMTHEAGHWLVLNDLYDDIYIEQTMYGVSSDRELKRRSLESGDIAGVRKIYSGATP